MKIYSLIVQCGIILLLVVSLSFGQNKGNVSGTVKDGGTGETLIGANILLKGTGFGAVTDINGHFLIRDVPYGSYTVRVSYLGYKTVEQSLELSPDLRSDVDFILSSEALEGQTVVVTAQAQGQNAAINQQLNSEQIVSVVSAAKIQELPDANAAESVGRLPGVSLLRNGGEASEVVIRGLQPKYNAVSVNGVRMASSNAGDRSADLSMISPYSLEGIEVIKSVTPDLDPDVLGGTVNFKMREAKSEREGLGYGLIAQGSYNGLSNAYNKFRNYKYVGNIEGRFFDNRLGLFAQADFERRNLTSNEFGAVYTHLGNSTTDYIVQGLNLNNVPRDKQRTNGTIDLDYVLPEGKISLSNFFSSGRTDIRNRGEYLDIQNNLHTYSIAYSKSTINMITNALEFDQQLPIVHLDARFSHSYSETKNPGDWTIGFQQAAAGYASFTGAANPDPYRIPSGSVIDPASTFLNSLTTNSSFSRERALAGMVDLDTRVDISDNTTVKFKFGGKYRHQTRSYVYDQSGSQGLGLTSAQFVDSLIASQFSSTAQYNNTTSIPITPFIDHGYSYTGFLDDDFPMYLPLNFDMLNQTAGLIRGNADLIAQHALLAYFHDNFNSTTNNYSGYENQRGAYIMATANIGQDITITPGVRYQDIQTTYTAPRGRQSTSSLLGGTYTHYDTTITVDHWFWLPDVIIKYKPVEWFDVRLSYTTTLAYPDYNAIVPKIDISTGGVIAWNNTGLKPTHSKNYDAYLSVYDNTIGLLTIGGFLKKIDNLIYTSSFFVSDSAALPYFPPGQVTTPPKGVYNINASINDPFEVRVYGLELDWQTHFWYFPHPFDGLVMNVNYTHVYSRAEYPYTDTRKEGRVIYHVDTSFVDRLLYQPNNIVNFSIGYDYGTFSIRFSMLYQADILTSTAFWPQLRTTTSPYRRWDISAKQDLGYGIQIYGDVNNLNNAHDVSVIKGSSTVPQSQQSYGLQGDLGIRLSY